MNLKQLHNMLGSMPKVELHKPTFLQIAGFPHYENVCSNILKFYFDPLNKVHGIKDLLLTSLFRLLPSADISSVNDPIDIRREYATVAGRIDIVIISDTWVLAIENKIRHELVNDLDEYAHFLDVKYTNRKIYKVVLSIKQETPSESSGFVNITYEQYLKEISYHVDYGKIFGDNEYIIFFRHFIQSLKHFYQSIDMKEQEIKFLIENSEAIEKIRELEDRLRVHIKERAYKIFRAVTYGALSEKGVYENHDLYFVYEHNGVEYKIDCPLVKEGIYITLCTHHDNQADIGQLRKLAIFNENEILLTAIKKSDEKLVLEGPIDFFTHDDVLIEKLNHWLSLFKVVDKVNAESMIEAQ